MPIVDLEIVVSGEDDTTLPRRKVQALADVLGDVFESGPTGTWVRVRSLPETLYAESRQLHQEHPVFVTILKAAIPDRRSLMEEMDRVAAAVAATLDRPQENIHVLYEPAAAGRIGFGGTLQGGSEDAEG